MATALLWIYVAGGDLVGCYQPDQEPRYSSTNSDKLSQSSARQQTSVFSQSVYEQVDCKKPRSDRQYELCQQWHTAKATKEATCIARRQWGLSLVGMVLSLMGLGGLAATIFYAAQTAEETGKAVRAAIAADRPRVRLSKLVFSRMMGDETDKNKIPIITATVKNYGRSAAVLSQARIAIMVTGRLPEFPDYNSHGNMLFVGIGKTLDPGEEHQFQPHYFIDSAEYTREDGDPVAEFLPFKAHLHVYGLVQFLDHVGDTRSHGFCALYNPPRVAANLPEGEQFVWQRKKNYSYDT